MEASGSCGRGGRDYTGADALLRGVLASEFEPKVYPDNYCIKCVKAGIDFEDCFHRHWKEKEAKRHNEHQPSRAS